MASCEAVGCTNSSQTGFILIRFPRDPAIRKLWIAAVRRDDWTPNEHSGLCENHFAPIMWDGRTRTDGRRKLKLNAVPTIFSSSTTATKVPLSKSLSENADGHDRQELPKVPTPELSAPQEPDLPKFIPGICAVCTHCGFLSEDFNKCIRCKFKLPHGIKAVPALVVTKKNSQLKKRRIALHLKKNGNVKGASSAKKMFLSKSTIKIADQETVNLTLSSDDDIVDDDKITAPENAVSVNTDNEEKNEEKSFAGQIKIEVDVEETKIFGLDIKEEADFEIKEEADSPDYVEKSDYIYRLNVGLNTKEFPTSECDPLRDEECDPLKSEECNFLEESNTLRNEECVSLKEHSKIALNSVQSLLSLPFSSRSTAEKAETKRLGRQTPILNQLVTTGKQTYKRTFNTNIYIKHPWICGCPVKNAFFCFPCLLFGGESQWTKPGLNEANHFTERIILHESTPQHMKNILQLALLGGLPPMNRRSIHLHNEKVRRNRYCLNILINAVRVCEAFERVLVEREELINCSAELEVALKEHLKQAACFNFKTSQSKILQMMFSVCQEEISKEIEETDYLSVIIDRTILNQVAIVFRYLTKGKLVERFWGFLNTQNQDAKTLATAINVELQKNVEDDKRKLIAQTYDGALIMGVQSIIKETYEHAAYVHCYAHQLNFVMLNAASANKNVRIFFTNLQGICKFFSSEIPTKWNLTSKIVYTVFINKQEILNGMQKIIDTSSNANSINQAVGYIKILNSKDFLFWLNLFYKIENVVNVLFAKFHAGDIDPISANKYVTSFESELMQLRNMTELEAKEVCDIIIDQAKARFGFTAHLIAATLFFAEKYTQYTTCFPEKNFQKTIKVYPFLHSQKLRRELSVIYDTNEFRTIYSLLSLYDLISQNSELSATFSETLTLLKILLTIPMDTSEVGRCFSTLGRIKTFLNNSARQEGLSALAMISLEKDLIESTPDFNHRVIEKFASAKDHCINFRFQ